MCLETLDNGAPFRYRVSQGEGADSMTGARTMSDAETPDVCKEIADLRRKQDMSREQFAAALGVTTRTILRWERGESTPQARHRQRIRRMRARVKV